MEAGLEQELEALLFVTDEPLSPDVLAELVERDTDTVRAALEELADDYEARERGLAIRHAAGGWRMYTAPATYETVERYALRGRSGRLTKAALETLAVVAYKQPVTRQEIADIRGVDVAGVVRSLTARGYVEEVGREEGPGRPILYGTTDELLERLGLDSLDDLPALTEFMPEQPAPDEPGPGEHDAARERLAGGGELAPTAAGSQGGLAPPEAVEAADDEEIDELSQTLERVARSAIDQLREAEEATARAQDPDADIPVAEDGHGEQEASGDA